MILVYVDHDRGVLDEFSLQAVAAARGLDADVQAVMVGADAVTAAARLGEFGVTTTHVAVDPRIADYTPMASGRAVAQMARQLSPAAVMAVGSPRGNEVLAHASAILDEPFAADCTAIVLGDGVSTVTRNRWAGNGPAAQRRRGRPPRDRASPISAPSAPALCCARGLAWRPSP